MLKLVKKKPKTPISLRRHYERRNRILIKRRGGGYGDILMQRMMMEDFATAFPEADVTFTCPIHYLEMAKNHPHAAAIDLGSVNEDDYGAVYDITTACRVHETRYGADNRDHRSDIWAAYCGLRLTRHNMHLRADPDMLSQCRTALNHYNREGKPAVLLATQSTNDDFGLGKSLTHNQINGLVSQLKDMGYYLYTVHAERQDIYDRLGVDQFTGIHPQAWIAMVALADYVISVDTATFHIAGGLGRPLVGVFAFTDGKVYGKYYDFVLVQKHRDDGNWDCGPCFNMSFCPKSAGLPKPCLTELSDDDIVRGFAEATGKWPFAGSGRGTAGTTAPDRTS